jgi:cobalamin biosynthesis protein CobD/CbiB
LEEGRRQVSRIVGRDTSRLSDQEIRTAALETLAENLSDGVIAPLFWYLLLGVASAGPTLRNANAATTSAPKKDPNILIDFTFYNPK